MPAPTLLNLLALVSVAILALSSVPVPVNALVADRAQVARHVHAHDDLARRKRSDSSAADGRCKPRSPSSSPTPTPTPTPTTSTSPPPPPATSSSPPSPSSAPPSTNPVANPSKKFCLAWGAAPEYLGNFADLPNVGAMYNWDFHYAADNNITQFNIPYYPMLWGPTKVGDFSSVVVQGYATVVLAVNEPNEPSQSDLTAQQALDLWMQYIAPLKSQGYTLVSPACTNDDAGLAWYKEFMASCTQTPGCEVDVMAFHSYTPTADGLTNFATILHQTYNLPVMITEFAAQDYTSPNAVQPTMDQVWDFAGQVRDFINSNDWIVRACPFGVMEQLPPGVNPNNALMNADGTPTSLAYFYFG